MTIFHHVRHATIPVHNAFLLLIFEAFPCTKFSLSGIVRKVFLSTFQNRWNFPILCSFAPPKVSFPNTTSCVTKKGQKGHFWGAFDPFGSSKLEKTFYPFLGNHNFAWGIQKCWAFFQRRSLAKVSARWHYALGRKICVLLQNLKINKKCAKFLDRKSVV